MNFKQLSPERRLSYYVHKAERLQNIKERAYKRLGNVCSCGSQDNLRIRFIDPLNPLKPKLAPHPGTLHNRILKAPEAASQVRLMCYGCRVRASISNGEKNNVQNRETAPSSLPTRHQQTQIYAMRTGRTGTTGLSFRRS